MSDRIFKTPAPAKATPSGPAVTPFTDKPGGPISRSDVQHVPNGEDRIARK